MDRDNLVLNLLPGVSAFCGMTTGPTMSDRAANEDPYGFTWAYPTLLIAAYVSLWFNAYAVLAGCVFVAAMIAFTMGLHLKRHLLPLDYATVHRSKSPWLFWTYAATQAGVAAVALTTCLAIIFGRIG